MFIFFFLEKIINVWKIKIVLGWMRFFFFFNFFVLFFKDKQTERLMRGKMGRDFQNKSWPSSVSACHCCSFLRFESCHKGQTEMRRRRRKEIRPKGNLARAGIHPAAPTEEFTQRPGSATDLMHNNLSMVGGIKDFHYINHKHQKSSSVWREVVGTAQAVGVSVKTYKDRSYTSK